MKQFTYEQMLSLLNELKSSVKGGKLLSILTQNPAKFIFLFVKEGAQKRLFFSFEKSTMRFHLIQKPLSYPLKTEGVMVSFLKGALLEEIELLNEDRLLHLRFLKGSKSFSFVGEFFSRHPNYYLLDSTHRLLFSLHKSKSEIYTLPEKPPASKPLLVSKILTSRELEESFREKEEREAFEARKKRLLTLLGNRKKKELKREETFAQKIRESSDWEKIQHQADLLKANLYQLKPETHQLEVWDWKKEKMRLLTFDGLKSPQTLVDEFYKKARKMKSALKHLERLLLESKEKQLYFTTLIEKVEGIDSTKTLLFFEKLLLNSLEERKKKKNDPESKIYREFLSANGLTILVGKNGKANEKLTFHYANGNDFWLHVNGFSGSHVIIKKDKGKPCDEQTLLEAMQLALYYSQAKDQGEAEVSFTERKHVKRFGKNQPGKVQICNQERRWVKLDKKLLESIKKRSDQNSSFFKPSKGM